MYERWYNDPEKEKERLYKLYYDAVEKRRPQYDGLFSKAREEALRCELNNWNWGFDVPRTPMRF